MGPKESPHPQGVEVHAGPDDTISFWTLKKVLIHSLPDKTIAPQTEGKKSEGNSKEESRISSGDLFYWINCRVGIGLEKLLNECKTFITRVDQCKPSTA